MDRKILVAGIGTLLLLIAIITAVLLFGKPDQFRGTYYVEPYPVAGEIELTRADGSVFKLSEERGGVVLLFFGYTSCPDVCPTTLADMKLAIEALKPAEAEQIKVIFITVDPARDTPERVQEYVDHFSTSFIGLSGEESELTKVWSDYGIFREVMESESATGYLVNHTARILLIDRNGDLRISFPYDAPVEDIIHDLKLALKE
ncbi:MAG TPA: SCO family protein [Anaerolineales bacterium]|jgi:protein SCO1/2|nr:SCO family protein [Anaerolineales bacterium]HQX15311.1 SCO family protein [Anaerolineales bacterium]